MDFISNKKQQIEEMLQTIGIESVVDLFADIPRDLLLNPPPEDDGLSEYEGMRKMEALSRKNTFPERDNYLGAGAYEHHVPAIVSAICSKSEFLTAYTPYQAEISQGMLQIIFEFQSAVCALTGMDVANASVYDGASACAEGCLMALRQKRGRNKIVLSRGLHPHYQEVVRTYLHGIAEVVEEGPLDDSVAACLIQSPNFFGEIEEIEVEQIRKNGSLLILCADPLSYGLFRSAGEIGADVAVGDMQSFGLPLSFGGPYVGYIAAKKELVRQIPGRIVGETTDSEGKRGFVLTLQAREQHIRREKATSNICSNQALAALASLVAILWYGKEGVRQLALTNYQRAAYLRHHLILLPGVRPGSEAPFFNEFTVHFERPLDEVLSRFREAGIEPGLPLSDRLLIAVTETKSKEQLDRYVEVAKEVCG